MYHKIWTQGTMCVKSPFLGMTDGLQHTIESKDPWGKCFDAMKAIFRLIPHPMILPRAVQTSKVCHIRKYRSVARPDSGNGTYRGISKVTNVRYQDYLRIHASNCLAFWNGGSGTSSVSLRVTRRSFKMNLYGVRILDFNLGSIRDDMMKRVAHVWGPLSSEPWKLQK